MRRRASMIPDVKLFTLHNFYQRSPLVKLAGAIKMKPVFDQKWRPVYPAESYVSKL